MSGELRGEGRRTWARKAGGAAGSLHRASAHVGLSVLALLLPWWLLWAGQSLVCGRAQVSVRLAGQWPLHSQTRLPCSLHRADVCISGMPAGPQTRQGCRSALPSRPAPPNFLPLAHSPPLFWSTVCSMEGIATPRPRQVPFPGQRRILFLATSTHTQLPLAREAEAAL